VGLRKPVVTARVAIHTNPRVAHGYAHGNYVILGAFDSGVLQERRSAGKSQLKKSTNAACVMLVHGQILID